MEESKINPEVVENVEVLDKVETPAEKAERLENELATTKDELSKVTKELDEAKVTIEKLNKITNKILKEYNELHVKALLETYYSDSNEEK